MNDTELTTYPTEPGWYCLGFDRLNPEEKAACGAHMEGIYQFTGEIWLDENSEPVQQVWDPALGMLVSITGADHYVRQGGRA